MYITKNTYTSKMCSNFIFNYINKKRERESDERINMENSTQDVQTVRHTWELGHGAQNQQHYLNLLFVL
jgi:hypothetical protein